MHAGQKQPTAEHGPSSRQDQHAQAHESRSAAPAAPDNEPSQPASSSEDALQACSFRARRGWSLQVTCTCKCLIPQAAALGLQAYISPGAEVLLQRSLPSALRARCHCRVMKVHKAPGLTVTMGMHPFLRCYIHLVDHTSPLCAGADAEGHRWDTAACPRQPMQQQKHDSLLHRA